MYALVIDVCEILIFLRFTSGEFIEIMACFHELNLEDVHQFQANHLQRVFFLNYQSKFRLTI